MKPSCETCRHLLPASLMEDKRVAAAGYGGACVHPTNNFHHVVYIITAATTRCGRYQEETDERLLALQRGETEED